MTTMITGSPPYIGLAAVEAKKYRRVWAMPEYRVASHGLSLWQTRRHWFPHRFTSALDIGCGLGRLFAQLNEEGIDAHAVDLVTECLDPYVAARWGAKFSQQCLWDMSLDRRFDVGICTDVMEHVPIEKVKPSLSRIAACCDTVVFKIAHGPSNDLGGLPLHLTLRPREWWMEQMVAIGGTAKYLGDVIRSGMTDTAIRWEVR